MTLEELCEKIYPLTIIRDRYTGTYSGGKFTAFNCEPEEIPEGIFGEDTIAAYTWSDIHKRNEVGIGDTIQQAVEDLYSKLHTDIEPVRRRITTADVIINYMSLANATSMSIACLQTLLGYIYGSLYKKRLLYRYDCTFEGSYESIESSVLANSQILDIDEDLVWLKTDKVSAPTLDSTILSIISEFLLSRKAAPTTTLFRDI